MSDLTREQIDDLIDDANGGMRNAFDALNWTGPDDDEWHVWIDRAVSDATNAVDALATLANATLAPNPQEQEGR